MNLYVTDLEMIQATLEIMGAVFGLICIGTLFLYEKTNVTRTLRIMLGISSIMLLFDAGAYVFRGNIDPISLVMTRICNFFVFFLQLLLLVYGVKLTYILIESFGNHLGKKIKYTAYILSAFAAGLLTTNLFTQTMYYFDENNYYHRNTGWYFYTAITVAIMIFMLGLVWGYRKHMNPGISVGIICYVALPLVSALVQSFLYGLSINNLAVTVSLVVILIINIRLARKKESNEEEYRSSRTLMGTICMLFLLMLTMSTSVIFNISKIQTIAHSLSEENTQTIFYMVKNDIENEFFQPIAVSDTIAQDLKLRALFDPQLSSVGEDRSEEVVEILDSIQKAFGYKMLFAICDATGNYYTYKGLSRTIDRYNDPNDSWYLAFLNRGIVRELNVDTDKDNNMTLNVFINRQILSDDGRVLGVCGVGLDMAYLCNHIRQYEEKYNVEICCVDRNGLIVLDSDIERIEEEYLENFDANSIDAGGTVFESMEQKSQMITYLENLGWYLCMIDHHPDKVDVSGIVTISVVIFLVGIFIMAVVFWVLLAREKTVINELEKSKKISRTDKLTGIENRRGYDNEIFRLIQTDHLKDLIIVIMDVNGLKVVNDSLGHDAGDELIQGTAKCISNVFGKIGSVYRTGGDEFMALLHCDKDVYASSLASLEREIANWSGEKVHELSISIGWACASDYPENSIDELERKADEAMYQNKSEYYTRTGKDRRRR